VGPGELFDDAVMAAGYASDRPPVHAYLIDRLRAIPALRDHVRVALDVGCGAGASAAGLRPLADVVVGVDPFVPMVESARAAVPDVHFAVAAAEALPAATGSVDLLTAAGALNFADLDAFVPEAERVLGIGGALAVMDYGFGWPTAVDLDEWPVRFAERWPRPRARRVDASSFARSSLRVAADERFVITLPMPRQAYLAYVLTDTAVAHAVAGGVERDAIRAWCDDALDGFGAVRPVAFAATLLVLTR
jgi:SAM-dependent methyltransferase